MILHVCSHFGDIEVAPDSDSRSIIRYERLTPNEKQALDTLCQRHHIRILDGYEKGEILIPLSIGETGAVLAGLLHQNKGMLTAIRFTSGDVVAKKGTLISILDWLRGKGKTPVSPALVPEAAVQVQMPVRGCPMPTASELKEQRAAMVVRKFLRPDQVEDFDRYRAFLVTGGVSGRLYRVTTRWNPEVEDYGVLHDLSTGTRVCASNLAVPPSEEALSMKLAVEYYEREFRGHHAI